jgi:hypothetical protein
MGYLTILPTSVEPRAKKKITSRHPYRVNSFSVVPTVCRTSSSAAGAAKTVVANAASRDVMSFMMDKGMVLFQLV